MADKIRFHSAKEAARYIELKLMERVGEVTDIEVQPRLPLQVNGIKICDYVADFKYLDTKTNQLVYEDVKSPVTAKLPLYRLKKKLVLALYSIKIKET